MRFLFGRFKKQGAPFGRKIVIAPSREAILQKELDDLQMRYNLLWNLNQNQANKIDAQQGLLAMFGVYD